MNIDRKDVLVLAAGAVLLSGCAVDPQTGDFIQYEFGESVKQTMMAQVVDPDPQYDTMIYESSGQQAAAAIDRYRGDNVKEPRAQRITAQSGSN